jgi:hypothetical protein
VVPDDRYRLAPVRDERTRTERVKRGDLAIAVGDARTTETALALAVSRVANARVVLATAVAARDATASVPARVHADRYVVRRRRDLEAAIAEELRASSAHDERLGGIDDARRVLARAHAEREVIERHFARWREDRRKAAERRED